MMINASVAHTARNPADPAAEHLAKFGYLVLENVVSSQTLEQARHDLAPHFEQAPFCEGLFYGTTTKRFGRLLSRLTDPDAFALHPDILRLVQSALGDGQGIQLNLTQAIEIHPGAPVQVPHRDHDMWRFEKAVGTTYMVNVMWPLDDFTADNGATRVWPGSNHANYAVLLPNEADALSVVAPAGSAILFLGQTLHSGGANKSTRPRRGMILSYCLDWLLPDENPWLAYPPGRARAFSPALAGLVGYHQRFAGLNNFEGRSPAVLLNDALPDYLCFADDMSPDQQELIAGYYRNRLAEPQA